MKNNFNRFALRFTLYVALILLISLAVYYWMPNIKINAGFVYILLFLYAITLGSFYYFNKSFSDRVSRSANIYMLGTFLKLIIYSVIIVIYAWLYRQSAVSFIITFFMYYLLLTVYEVVALLRNTG